MRGVLRAAVGVVLVVSATAAGAATLSSTIDGAATPAAPGIRITAPVDAVSIGEVSLLSATVESRAVAAAGAAGGVALPVRLSSVGMTALRRGPAVVQQPPSGAVVPMIVSVLPVDAAAVVMDRQVAAHLAAGELVFGETSAVLRGAAAGDTIDLRAADGSIRSLRIGMVATDRVVGGAELVASSEIGAALGITQTTRLLVWGFRSRQAIDDAIAAAGLVAPKIRIVRSWDPPNPDGQLSSAETKRLLGEFWYRESGTGLTLDPAWESANIVPRSTMADIPLRVACHRLVQVAVQGALSEIAAAGLAGEIDVANSNAVGGCFVPRLNRVTGNLGFVSRHSWGQAIDINVRQNPQGSVPKLDCGVVRIFRKWGFAWGGNFTSLDGMHFEYVGERRDQWAYPSRYCPNLVAGKAGAAVADSRTDLLADEDGVE